MLKQLNICRTTRQVKEFFVNRHICQTSVKLSFYYTDQFHLASFNFKMLPLEGEFPEIINNVNVILSEQICREVSLRKTRM